MAATKFLYSTNTLLALRIGRKYYEDIHYVYVTSDFGCESLSNKLYANPPTSSPLKIYKNLQDEIEAGDLHSEKIDRNRIGLRKGVQAKRKAEVIDEQKEQEILKIIERAETRDFKPLLYIMSYKEVKHLLKPVPVEERAHPLADEYIIESLPGDLFEVQSFDEF